MEEEQFDVDVPTRNEYEEAGAHDIDTSDHHASQENYTTISTFTEHAQENAQDDNSQESVQENARVFPRPGSGMIEYHRNDITLVQLIGEGGQGEIHLAVVDVAPKPTWPGYVHKPEYRSFAAKVFKGEARNNMYGQWPDQVYGLDGFYQGFICAFHGYCKDFDGRFCLLMQKYDCCLRTVIDQEMRKKGNGRPFRSVVALHLIIQVALGMAALHRSGVIHRDLKAANVFVYKDAENNIPWGTYIGDFDIGKNTMGTRFWRAPEILKATEERVVLPFTFKSDVYSFGMTCYEILTGKIPLRNQSQSDYESIYNGKRPDLPGYLNKRMKVLISKCWLHEQAERPTFLQIVEELRDMISGSRIFENIFECMESKLELGKLSSITCLSTLEDAYKKLREKYPSSININIGEDVTQVVHLFVRPGEEDFVRMGFHFIALIKHFVRKFGWYSYVEQPSLPWSQWIARQMLHEKIQRMSCESGHALPFIEEKMDITKLKTIVMEATVPRCIESNECLLEENVSSVKMTAQMKRWRKQQRKRAPLLDRHYGCVRKNNYGHHDGDYDYPICWFCKDEKPADENAQEVCTFHLFYDEYKRLKRQSRLHWRVFSGLC